MLETHLDDRFDQLPRFIGVEGRGATVGDRAVGTVTSAHPAVDEEGGGSAGEALGTVGTACLLAHRVQASRSHPRLDLVKPAKLQSARANPIRQRRSRDPASKAHGATTQASGKPAELILCATRSAEPRSGNGPILSLKSTPAPASCTVIRCW